MGQAQVQTPKQIAQPQTVEEVLDIKFGNSKLDNAIALIVAVAYKYYDTVVPINTLAQDIIATRFYMTDDKEYAEAEIVIKTGLKLIAWIGIGKKGPEYGFRFEHLQSCDCYCGEK